DVNLVEEIRIKDIGKRRPVEEVVRLEPVGQRHASLLDITMELAQRRQSCASQPRRGLDNARAQKLRHEAVKLEYSLARVTRVATEQLIAAIPGEHNVDAVRTCHAGTEVRRYSGFVAERLVIGACNDRNRGDHVVGSDVILPGEGFEVARCDTRVFHFVETLRGKAD